MSLASWVNRIPISFRVLENIAWLFFDKFLRLAVGVTIGVWVARYLGPERFGQLNYAMALVALCAPFASLGLKDIVIRRLIHDPSKSSEILGSAFFLRLVGGISAFSVALLAVKLVRPEDATMQILVAVIGSSLLFGSSEIISFWFESRVWAKYVVWVQNLCFIIGSFLKVCLLVLGAPVFHFAVVIALESLVAAIGLVTIFSVKSNGIGAWLVRNNEMLQLIKKAWPLFLSGLAVTIYMKIDQIMLGEMLGEKSVGIFSAALQVSTIWYAVPMIVASTLYPIMLNQGKNDPELAEGNFRLLTSGLASLALMFCFLVSFVSEEIITILFGAEYSEAASILIVHVWAGLFVSIGVTGSRWYLVHGLERMSLYRTIAGAVVNIVANLILIPAYGALGAAFATLISFGVSALVYDSLSRSTRPLFVLNFISVFWGPIIFIREFRRLRKSS